MPNLRKPKNNDIVLNVPNWVGKLYITMAILLLPWIVYLALTLPSHHHTNNWDVIWTGFDIGLLLALFCTAVAAYTKSIYIVIAASAAGALQLVDAWFDLLSESSSRAFDQALVLALLVELPLAFMSFYIASHALRQNAKPHLVKKPR